MKIAMGSQLDVADAILGLGLRAGGRWPAGESAIRHVGEPETVNLDFRDVDTTTATRQDRDFWRERVRDVSWGNHRVEIRFTDISSQSVALARTLRKGTAVGSVFIVDDTLSSSINWGWPLQLTWLRDSAGDTMSRGLEKLSRYERLNSLVNVVEFGDDDMAGVVDFLLIPAHQASTFRYTRGVRVNALIIMDDDIKEARKFADHLEAGAVLMPGTTDIASLILWLVRLAEELSHKNPLDVAMGKISNKGIVIGGPDSIEAPLARVTRQMAERFIEVVAQEMGKSRSLLTDSEIDLPVALTRTGEEFVFSSEGRGAAEVSMLRRNNRLDTDLHPEPGAIRYLQAAIYCEGKIETLEYSFVAGAKHCIHLWIGAGATGFLRAQTPAGQDILLDIDTLQEDAKADIIVSGKGIETRILPMKIYRSRTSDTVSIDFTVPKSARTFTLTVVLLVDGRLLQSGVVKGPVTPQGGKARRKGLPVLRFVVGSGVADLSTLAIERSKASLTVLENPKNAQVSFNRGIREHKINKLAQHFGTCLASLTNAQVDTADDTWLASENGAKAFHDLARLGLDAFDSLFGGIELTDPTQLQAIIDADFVHVAMFDIEESRLAIELLYDRALPNRKVWCKHFKEALETGRCPGCQARTLTSTTTGDIPVCPAGFWGVRKVIERATVEYDASGFPVVLHNRNRTSDSEDIVGLNRVLIGTSSRVDAGSGTGRKPTEILLERIAPIDPKIANSWEEWQKHVADRIAPPQVLVLLAHTGNDCLELGDAATLHRLSMGTSLVREPRAAKPSGPIVLLLGCDTATSTSSLNSFVYKFQCLGAPLVVGTVGFTLGRYAAPIAGEIVSLLADPDGPNTMGEVVLKVRRESLAKGCITGLLITSFGAADFTFTR